MSNIIFALLFFLSSGGDIGEINPRTSTEQFSGFLEMLIPELLGRYEVPGVSIALIRRGELAALQSYGYAHRDERLPMTDTTLFRAESVSKMFTAWGIMRLYEQGKLDLDTPVVKYLTRWTFPESNYDSGLITARMLLTHTSGLPVGGYDEVPADKDPPSLEESLSGYGDAPAAVPVHKPGTSFRYSNPGYAVLELLVEEIDGRSFVDFMEVEILTPLKMNRSTFRWHENLRPQLAVSYDRRGNPVPVYRQPVKAHAELYTTAADLAQFVISGINGYHGKQDHEAVLLPESFQKLYTPYIETTGLFGRDSDAMGLGHFIEYISEDRKAVFHGGEGKGFLNMVYVIPETGEGIIILTNSKRSAPLIADVLKHWGKWQGVEISMTRTFSPATVAVVVLIVLFLLILIVLRLRSKRMVLKRSF